MNSYNLFVNLLIVQMFYALSVTLILPYMPTASTNQVVMFTNSNNVIDFTTLGNSVQSGVGSQTSLPLLDAGALIFYSSATILNLMINFFTAIPQMVTLLLSGLFLIIQLPYALAFTIKSITFVIVTILYYMILFSFITGTRTGGGVLG